MTAWAHAQLFATLASQGADGVVVLRELTQRIKKKAGPAADVVLRMIAACSPSVTLVPATRRLPSS